MADHDRGKAGSEPLGATDGALQGLAMGDASAAISDNGEGFSSGGHGVLRWLLEYCSRWGDWRPPV